MSWDLSILKFSRQCESVDQIPEDETPLNLGPRTSVHKSVSKIFTGTNWTDPAWGVWDSENGSVEFNLGDDDPSQSLMLHVRANAEIIPMIVSLCADNGWHAVDCSSGNFIEKSMSPESGLNRWAAYRDQVGPGEE